MPLKGFRVRVLRGLMLALALGMLLGAWMPAAVPAYAQGEATLEITPTPTATATPDGGLQSDGEGTGEPVPEPSDEPTLQPTAEPTAESTVEPTATPEETATPTSEPAADLAPSMEDLLAGMEPSFSADGLTAYDAAPVLVIVEDPNPQRAVMRQPYTGEIPLMLAGASASVIFVPAGQTDKWGNNCSAFPSGAQTAFSHAAALWASAINSPLPITIQACWASFSGGTLGFGGTGSMHVNFEGAPLANFWYAAALANALSGADKNTSDPEIHISINQNQTWYFGTDANPPLNAFDLVTVALHEIAHGLNFFGSARIENSVGKFGFGSTNIYPVVYDIFMKDVSGFNLTTYANPSVTLANLLESNNLWFHGTHAMAANGGSRVKMYAPSTYVSGSSYAHLDYDTYKDTVNNLMVYSITKGSANHNSGPVTQGLLRDLGWDILPQSPETPTNPTSLWSTSHTPEVPDEENNIISMQWSTDAQAGAGSSLAGYSISWDQNPTGSPDTLADLPPDVYQTDSPALANGSWYFHLRTCDIYEHCAPLMHAGPYSIGTMDSDPPSNPGEVRSTSHAIGLIETNNNVISMLWSADADDGAGSGVAGYSILWDQAPETIPDETVDILDGQYSASSLPLGNGDWYFHLRTCDLSGNCAPAAEHAGPYLLRVYPPPVQFEPDMNASPENRRPFFEWSAVEGATSYVLQVSRYSNFSTSALKITTGSTYYQPASDLPRGRVLYWRVRGRGEFGRTAWSEVFSFNSPATPSTPKLGSPAKGALVRDPQPLLRWYASSMQAGSVFGYYQVQLARDAGFTDLVYEDEQVAGQYQTGFTPGADLAPGMRYYWRVRAYNDQDQHSAWSAVWNFRQAIPPPQLIEPAEGITTADLSPLFEWSAVDNADSYSIQVSRNISFSTSIFAATVYDGTSFTSSRNLPAGRTLYWRVRANHAEFGPGKWSDLGSFSTPPS